MYIAGTKTTQMPKPLLCTWLAVCLICACSFSQTPLTNREIFDFEVGDEFHIRKHFEPGSLRRIKILDKYYSTDSATVYYLTQRDDYITYYDPILPPPSWNHIEYHFTQTDSYTNLDQTPYWQPIVVDSCTFLSDSTYHTPQEYCDVPLYATWACLYCCFEGFQRNKKWAKGLGLVYDEYEYPAKFIHDIWQLGYYKKKNGVCGTPYTLSTPQQTGLPPIRVYPNPAYGEVTLTELPSNATVHIYDITGKTVATYVNPTYLTIDVSNWPKGLYTIYIQTKNQATRLKLVVGTQP